MNDLTSYDSPDKAGRDFDAERRTGIGGSDAAAAIGVSPWRTPYDLWCEKTGNAAPLPVTEPMRWGTLLEDVILNEYCRRTGRAIGRNLPIVRHPDYHWLIGHIDARVLDTSDRIVEAKTSGISIGWGEPGTDEIPQHYLVQCHHYLALMDAKVVDVAVLIGGSDFRLYEVHADPDIAGALIEQEHAFWQCVIDRIPPAPSSTKDAVRRWGRMTNVGAVYATEDEMEAIVTLRQCRAEHHELEGVEEAARLRVMARLSDLGDTLVDLAGTPLCSWKLDNGRKGYVVEAREPSRRFQLRG